MSHNTFHFVSPRTPANGAHWVDRSKALSHSAKIAHKRRKQNALAASKTSLAQPSRTSAGDLSDESKSIKVESPDKELTERALSFDAAGDDDSGVQSTKEETKDPSLVPYIAKPDWIDVSSATVQLPKAFSRSTLDPFFRPATHLSVPDEHVLHLYLQTIPHQIYGTTTGDESSVIQSQTMAVIASNTIGILWLLMTIEANVTSFQPTQLDTYRALLSKRTRALRLMAERLKDPKSSCRDDFVLATAIAAGCERRLGNVEEARRHLLATKRILNLRGGLHTVRSMPFTLGLMVVNIFVEQSMVNFFESMSVLTNKITWLNETLRAWQTHNLELRNSAAFSGEQIRYTYRMNRAAAFTGATPLRKFVQSIVEAASNGHERASLGFLFAMNHTFWAFRKNDDIAMVYLEKLIDAVKRSASANFVLQAGDLQLPSMLLLLKISQSSVQPHQWDAHTRAVLQIEQVFEFVNLLAMASDHSRATVISALFSWLASSTLDANETVILSDSTLDCLRKEIISSWYKEQRIEDSPKLVEID